jgi:hypothetical protein
MDVCKIGIRYDSVRQERIPGVVPERLPCWGRWKEGCSKYSGFTPEEIKAQDEEKERYFRSWELTRNACLEACNNRDDASDFYKKLKEDLIADILFKLSVEEFEEDNIPFGVLNALWKRLNIEIQEGAEVYYYYSSEWTWKAHCGREGYIIVREDQLVDNILISLS